MDMEFSLSKHPFAQGYDRKLIIIGPFIDLQAKQVSCHCVIKHYTGQEASHYIDDKHINMFTSNDKYVLDGQRVEPDENGVLPGGSEGEFDFLWNFGKEQYGVSIGELIESAIGMIVQRNDQDGNFNDLTVFPS